MSTPLTLEVFVGDGNAFFVTSTIVYGERDAVVVDAQFTRTDARRLAGRIKELGKNLTTVYITHGHPDHYWGLEVLRQEFPEASFVTAPEALDMIEKLEAPKVAQWKPLYGDQVPDVPIRPEPLEGDFIHLEGADLQVLHLDQGDVTDSTAIWIPDLSAVVAGDFAYNGAHVWLAEANPKQQLAWIANLDKLAAINPTTVVAGHKVPGTDDAGPRVLDETKAYVELFHREAARASSEEELIASVTAAYPDRALPIILQLAAQAAFAARVA